MPTVTKRRRATKRPADPPALPAVNLEPRGIGIYPELMELDAGRTAGQFLPGDLKPYIADIREHDGRKPHQGRRLFTITIDPLLNAESATRIVALILNAPDLWRTVRGDYAGKFSEPDAQPGDFADFAAAHQLPTEDHGADAGGVPR